MSKQPIHHLLQQVAAALPLTRHARERLRERGSRTLDAAAALTFGLRRVAGVDKIEHELARAVAERLHRRDGVVVRAGVVVIVKRGRIITAFWREA